MPRASTELSLGRRLAVSLFGMSVLVVTALGAASWAYVRQVQARDHLVNVVDRARVLAQELLDDYIDEETGVRGYILTAETSFLQPYYSGLAQARSHRAALAALEAQDPTSDKLMGKLGAVTARWQANFAAPAIAATRRGDRYYASPKALEIGKNEFDAVRSSFGDLDAALQVSADASISTLDHSEDAFVATAVILVSVLVAGAAAGSWALRSWVTAPLRDLGRDARRVAEGDLDHKVVSTGPPDLVELAEDVDAMRERIVSELRSLAEATDALHVLNQDLHRSNQELEQFAYVASHDLQEPLRKVVSFCQLLENRYSGQLDERAREYIAYAVDGASRMQVLINDLLAFSRVGRSADPFVPVDLGSALQSALFNLSNAIAEASAEVVTGELPTVPGNPTLLVALLQNLVGNAVKFAGGTAPRVEVSARANGEMWELAVADNGIGIEARFADRVFVIFQRLHGRDEYGGTGIGLALCKKIVEFHGGQIWLDTAYSPGTRICWTLPMTR